MPRAPLRRQAPARDRRVPPMRRRAPRQALTAPRGSANADARTIPVRRRGATRGERVDISVAHGFRGLEREATREDREAREQPALALVEELEAPRERVSQRLVPRGPIAGATREKPEAIADPFQHRLGGEQRRPR